MKILALESSGLVASAAVVEDDNLLAEYTIHYKKTHSQTLLPMIDEIVRMTELELSELDAIAVSEGPGSFTGLRIGSATAKGLGLALDKPLVAVPTTDALAYNLYDTPGLVCPVMDARRHQVYTGLYSFVSHRLQVLEPSCAMSVEERIRTLNEKSLPVTFVGDAIPVYREELAGNLTVPFSFAPAHLNKQRAGALACLAERYFEEGRIQSADAHRPNYLRPSQAERERAQREKTQKESVQTAPVPGEAAQRENIQEESE